MGKRRIPKHAQKVFEGELFSVWQWEQKLFDGSTVTYEYASRCDAAHAIGVLPDKRILLTWDEQPDRKAVLTPPGGKVEEGETPEETVRREFLEETGHNIGTLVPWHTYRPGGKIDYTIHAFVGRDLTKIGEPKPEAGEKIELRTFAFDEFLRLGSNADMRDMKIRTILLEAQLDPTKKEELKKLLYE